MHGRKKSTRQLSETELEAIAIKSKYYQGLVDQVFHSRNENVYSAEALVLTGKMLQLNPDFYTFWNYRREILISMYENVGLHESITRGKICEDIGSAIRNEELNLTVSAIKKNPKSYGAWYHRQWIIERFITDYNQELELCKEFLKQDQRNFHCWNYRRFIIKSADISPQQEMQFTTMKIEENFSNYSALHHRSKLIIELDQLPHLIIDEELSIIENAYFTEPDDQSIWWYLQFILRWAASASTVASSQSSNCNDNSKDNNDGTTTTTSNSNHHIDSNWFPQIIEKEIRSIRSLLEAENNCKWAIVTLTELLLLQMKLKSSDVSTSNNNSNIAPPQVASLASEYQELLLRLCDIDPCHRRRYEYLMQNF